MKKKWVILFINLIIIFIVAIIILKYLNEKVAPTVMDYSIGEMKRVASTIINRSIRDDTLTEDEINRMFIVTRSREEEVLSVTLDSSIVNKITNRISDACEDNLRMVEEYRFNELKKKFNIGEEYFLVPAGILFNNTILSSIGPKIPIRIKIIGNVTSGIVTDVKEYGINNSLITVSVEIKVELMVILPFSSDYVSITNYLPIAIKLIQGKVPQVYGGSLLN